MKLKKLHSEHRTTTNQQRQSEGGREERVLTQDQVKPMTLITRGEQDTGERDYPGRGRQEGGEADRHDKYIQPPLALGTVTSVVFFLFLVYISVSVAHPVVS